MTRIVEPFRAIGTKGVCVVKGMTLPASAQHVILRTPASAGSVSVSWPGREGESDGSLFWDGTNEYWAILVGASNSAGSSKYTIAASASWCGGCTF